MTLETAQDQDIHSQEDDSDGYVAPESEPKETEFYDEPEDTPGEEAPEPVADPEKKAPDATKDASADADPWETLDRDARAQLLQWSRRIGMNEREAKEFTPNGLRHHLTQLAQSEIQRQQIAWQQQQQQAPKPPEQFQPDWKSLEGEIHEELLKNLQGGFETQNKVITQLQQQLQYQAQQFQYQAQQQQQAAINAMSERFESRIEGMIGKQPELEKLFGTGTISDLREGSPEYENRLRLFEEFYRQIIPSNGTGSAALGEGRAFEKALNAAFSRELKEFDTKKLADRMRDNAKGTTARPSSAGKKPRDGVSAAIAISKELDRKHGLS